MKLEPPTLIALGVLVVLVIFMRRRAAAAVPAVPEPSAAPTEVGRIPPPKWVENPPGQDLRVNAKPWGNPVPGWNTPATSAPPPAATPPSSGGWTTSTTDLRKTFAAASKAIVTGPPLAPAGDAFHGWGSPTTYKLGGLGQ